jgi:PAS domain S-box-containing protein
VSNGSTTSPRENGHVSSAELIELSPGLQQVYDTAPVGLAFLDTDCRYLMINHHLTEICGMSVEDHIGRTVRETVPQVAPQVEQIVHQIKDSGEPVIGIEINGQRLDGSNVDRVWITYWHPFKNANGEVIGINVAAEEITERKRADAERAAMQNRLQQLNELLAERVELQSEERERFWRLSQDLLLVAGADGTILDANPAWTTTLGWPVEELIGKIGALLIHPDDRARSLEELANLEMGRPSPHVENRIQCKDGSYRWLSWRAISDRSSIYAIARDVTNIRKSQEQLHMMRREHAHVAKQEAIDAMTASIAHEIRQPLGAIAANASAGLRWLKRVEPNLPETEAALSRIVRDTERLDRVITSTRAIFRKGPGAKRLIDVRSLIDEALTLTGRELEAAEVLAQTDVANDVSVFGDRVQLQQVLVNLIMNAIEAMSVVDDRKRILTVNATVEAQTATISLRDTGGGIKQENINRVFEPFFTTKSKGMGLGLSICRSIVEAHNGRLSVESRGFESIFHMTLATAKS